MNGYGYQWKINPLCCKAAAIEAGTIAPDCGNSTAWFWGLAAVALGLAVFLPARGRRA